jgi:SAM-dependent methyltransferase
MKEGVGECILCGSDRFRPIHRIGEWTYLRCLKCGLVRLHPRPDPVDLTRAYQSYLPSDASKVVLWEKRFHPIVVRSADLIESRFARRGGRILDVGSGYGFFLGEMKARGWRAEGVELCPTGTAYCKGRFHVAVHPEPLEEIGFEDNTFDVVTLFYVVEHVHDPRALLSEVNRILRPGGLLLMRWPHTTPIVRTLGPLSTRLDLYHTPYHLHDFSPRTIGFLLSATGFDKPETLIGGAARPEGTMARWSSVFFGRLGEAMFRITAGKILLPGVSKTTLAFKGE